MATPDNSFNQRQRELDELNRRRSWYAGGGWFPFWWIWFLIIVCCALWFAGWGWGNYGGWWWGREVRAEVPAVTGTGVVVLNSPDKSAYVGNQVNLQNVPVQRRVNSDVLWIGMNQKDPMLLVLTNGSTGNTGNINVRAGDRITVNAQVQKVPSATAARQDWKLTTGGANRLEREQAYLQAPQISAVTRYER